MQKKIETKQAPQAIGPYSQGIRVNSSKETLFVSGQLPINPESGKIIDGDIRILTNRVLDNIQAILEEAGSGFEKVVKVDIFLIDLKGDFSAVNEEYGKRFSKNHPPARQTVQVSELPLGAPIEISCIAYI
jgi:2-iminobutanoate/2-iminopropanoate deaminase